MSSIHQSAIIEKGAKIADNVTIGAFSVIGAEVEIGEGTWIGNHVTIEGQTRIGQHNRIFHGSVLGAIPQDKKYAGEATRLEIGDHNLIREFCTFNLGTVQDEGVTSIGDHNWIMAYVHLAHDCRLGNHLTIANCTQLAGHVKIEDFATLGGYTAVHQFCRIGAYAMIGADSLLLQDVPPYVTVGGSPVQAHGTNSEGLKRRGFTPEAILNIRRAYKVIFRQGHTLAEALAILQVQLTTQPELQRLIDFLSVNTGRGIVR